MVVVVVCVVGYGCTRCIGNSVTLEEEVAKLIEEVSLNGLRELKQTSSALPYLFLIIIVFERF